MGIREKIEAEIGRELARRQAVTVAEVLERIGGGDLAGALDDICFFLPPRAALTCLRGLGDAVRTGFCALDRVAQAAQLEALTELAIRLASFYPRWNLQDHARHGAAVLSEQELDDLRGIVDGLLGELVVQAPRAEQDVLLGLCRNAEARLRAEKAADPEGVAAVLGGNGLQGYVASIVSGLEGSQVARMARQGARTGMLIGNDYACFLDHAMYLGASYATTNPVLVAGAWDVAPERWQPVVEALEREHPTADADEIARRFTLEVVLDNMLRLRPLFLLGGGTDGLVCLQVDPRRNDDPQAMVAYAETTYAELTARLDGGRPNVVFKLPGTAAGLVACEALTAQGIGVTITVNFGLYQHLPFARVIARGQALVSYLVEMNGRLAYPVRDELLEKLEMLAALGISEAEAREAAAWAGVAVLKRLQALLDARGEAMARVRPLVASLRVYHGTGYDALPSPYPDVTECLGTGVISIFPDVRRAMDSECALPLDEGAVERPVPERLLAILCHSEVFKQAYYVADREWVAEEEARYCPEQPLDLEQREALLSWPPVALTLGQFMDSYQGLVERIAAL